MNLTPEQSAIVIHIRKTKGLTLVSAVAGAGKTTLLVSIADTLKSINGLYLAYTKSIAVEAARKFPDSIHCCTTHSLAYTPTVIDQKLKLGFFNHRSITHKSLKKYDDKILFLDIYKEYCLSDYLSFSDFIHEEDHHPDYISIGDYYFDQMSTGKIDCTHEFYLKLFHLQLADGTLSYDPFDLIMLDEAGDLNKVTLAIFNLLPSDKKIMVGDPFQNIFTFNHTINCFNIMKDKGTLLPMSQSFRVADHIAEKIEGFCQKYLDPSMQFKGVPIRDTTIKTRAYISRTNASLIFKMMELNSLGTPYGLTRKAKQIFELPLLICSFKHRGFIPHPEFKHLQADIDHYYDNQYQLSEHYKTVFSYLANAHSDDIQLVNTIKLVAKYGKAKILNCYEEARKHEKTHQPYMLGTAHSMKGLEADEVTLAPDLNEAIADTILKITVDPEPTITREEQTELNLYYVAISRSRKSLINAVHI